MIVPIIIMEIDIYMKNKCTFRKAKYKKIHTIWNRQKKDPFVKTYNTGY